MSHNFKEGDMVYVFQKKANTMLAQVGAKAIVTATTGNTVYDAKEMVWVRWIDDLAEVNGTRQNDGGYFAADFAHVKMPSTPEEIEAYLNA